MLKDLITYFKDLHKSYETRSKSLLSASNVINNTSLPPDFLSAGGIGEATSILRNFHKQALNEAHKARDLENEVILQLTGLRSDLSQKIKEIKSLSGDFKNTVGKEQDVTRKVINSFQEALGHVDRDASGAGRDDPFIQKLAVERQIDRQVEEENYLHRVSSFVSIRQVVLTSPGLSEFGGFRSRTRIDCDWRDSKSIQRALWYSET